MLPLLLYSVSILSTYGIGVCVALRTAVVQPFACPRTLLCNRTSVNGQYGDPFNCSRFYLCIDGQSFASNCPVGMSWSERAGHCDWTQRADCDLRLLQRYDIVSFRDVLSTQEGVPSTTSLLWYTVQDTTQDSRFALKINIFRLKI